MAPVNVLIIDDEEEFVSLIVKRLGKRGLSAAGVTSGRKGLEHLEAHTVDVVILDVMMPDLNGLDTLKEIKKRHPTVEVIMLTGHGSVKTGLEGMSYGAFDYVLKPYNIDELLQKIHIAAERKALRGE
ncbi:response regulator [Megalodesulfovibrio gigas]|uniref:Putative response regulator receiver protein n=1 Tax=Megalodesulfovibrio gigas (strain ATCC 19364 / DSM 1382 / NCIMB 9332 / VKM B-1759) TaxID=1121448 RepID=T2GFQ7_MEGG1|nr:response regulator [Megalodesulfovibrio gigas]AGW14762.1 putative response regulator receiver protein [Megalodesulfovibrio gigas DSM 1382 = ATCC 19364]